MDRHSFTTPSLSNRTITTTNSNSTGTRLPTRRLSVSEQSNIPMTTGRIPRLSSSNSNLISDASISRLPALRRPSISRETSGSLGYVSSSAPTPSTASRIGGTLKRTSSGAGLPQDSELSSVKRQLTKAIHSNEDVKHNYERQLLELTNSNSSLQNKLKESAIRIEKLEAHRSLLAGKNQEIEEREKELRIESERIKTETQTSTRTLRQQLSQVKEDLTATNQSYRALQHSSSQALLSVQSLEEKSEGLENEVELLREEKAELEARWLEERGKRTEVEAELERKKGEERDQVNEGVLREELHRQVNHLKTLEKDNAKLLRRVETFESQHANLDLLKESNKTLEKKLKVMEELRNRCAKAEILIEGFEREKLEWISFLSPNQQTNSEFSSPRKLTKTLAQVQIENNTFKNQIKEHELELLTRDTIVGRLEKKLEVTIKDLEECKAKLFKSESLLKSENGGKHLLEKEVLMLKRHLDTYTLEESINPSTNFDQPKSLRLIELESHLETLKLEINDLYKQVNHWRGLVERYGGSTTEIVQIEMRQEEEEGVEKSLEGLLKKNKEMGEELVELRNENALLIKEVESLELQNDRLTYEHNNGAYDPTKTRVLQLNSNPSLLDLDLRTSTMDRLKEENLILLETIGELERKKGGIRESGEIPMVPRSSLENLQVELETTLNLVTQKETLLLRINKAFSAKADEFRKVVFSLLGYRIDFLTGGQVRVSSAYAPNKDHSLLFVSSPDGVGTMELVGAGSENGVVQNEVRNQIRFWVGERGSIPGFLASLTLTLFESTTKGSSVGFVVQD